MLSLTPNYWDSFKVSQAKGKKHFNGVKFEELVRDVLNIYFDGSWESTSVTWDGGKDFVDRSIPGKQSWAECKMYEKTLSINKISNSLVMAINRKDVDTLLIFSYSALNRNAIQHLSGYSNSTSIRVSVFDDTHLERLILGSKVIMNKFFKGFVGEPLAPHWKETLIRQFFSTETNIEYSQLKFNDAADKKRYPSIPINTPCLYEIIFRSNEILKTEKYKIDISKILYQREELGILNLGYYKIDSHGCIIKNLLPGEVYSIKLFFSPKVIGTVKIPEIIITSKNQRKTLPLVQLQVSRLNRPSLIGSVVVEALKEFETKISGSNRVSTTVLSGKSGVGKSRFLEESEISLLSHNYIPIQVDGHSNLCKNFASFIQTLLSQIWRLPNIEILRNDAEDSVVNTYSKKTVFDRVCAVLFKPNDNIAPTDKEIQEVFQLIIEGFLRQRMALLIDNVQGLDNYSLRLIARLTETLTDSIGQNAILLVFNEDELIYSQEATLFHQNLKKNAATENKKLRQFITLLEFNENSVKMFLNTVCNSMDSELPFTEHYPELTKLICENVLPRPLDLYQLFLAAQDERNKIATLQNGFFFIRDIEGFHELVKKIHGTTESILQERLLNLTGNSKYVQILLTLSCLGEVDRDIFSAITGQEDYHIKQLIDNGWLKYSEGNKITFFHPVIERFIIKTINSEIPSTSVKFFNVDIKMKIAKNIRKVGYANKYQLALFYLSKEKSNAVFSAATEELRSLHDAFPSSRNKMYAQALSTFIIQSPKLSPSLYLDCVQTICRLAAEGRISDLIERLLTYRISLNQFVPANDRDAYALIRITRQYASYSSVMGRPSEGDKMLVKELSFVRDLPQPITSRAKEKMKIDLMNRRCVCLKDMGKLKDAENVGKKALNLARKGGFPEYVCLSLIDISAVYKREKKDLKKFVFYVDEAIGFFNMHKEEIGDSSIELSCLENQARVAGLRDQTNTAIKYAERVIAISRDKNDSYYLLRGLSIKALFLLQRVMTKKRIDRNALKTIRGLVNEFEDLALVSRLDKFYQKALHLHAIICIALKDYKRAEDFLRMCLTKVPGSNDVNISGHYISPANISLILDAINFWKTHLEMKEFPLKLSFFVKTGLQEVPPNLISRKTIKPRMLFASKDFNYPFV